jgi:hypothetical protein
MFQGLFGFEKVRKWTAEIVSPQYVKVGAACLLSRVKQRTCQQVSAAEGDHKATQCMPCFLCLGCDVI